MHPFLVTFSVLVSSKLLSLLFEMTLEGRVGECNNFCLTCHFRFPFRNKLLYDKYNRTNYMIYELGLSLAKEIFRDRQLTRGSLVAFYGTVSIQH
jgi:hypothetical protein